MYQRLDEKITSSVDWFTIAIYLVIVICGWLNINAASYQFDVVNQALDERATMQLVWIGVSLLVGFIILKLDSNIYDILGYYIYFFFILLLIVTIFVAPDVKGSRSWINLGVIRVQPAEFAKFASALALAKFMSSYNFKLLTFNSLAILTMIILLPMAIIFLQNETGSALVFGIFILVLYREGLPGIILLLAISVVIFFIVGIKYSQVDVGILSEGEFICTLLVVLISVILVVVYQRDALVARNIVLGSIVLMGLNYLLSLLGASIDWSIVAIIIWGATCLYLLYLAKKHWLRTYLFITLFALFSFGFINSIDYIFWNIAQPHQQNRVMVLLGMKQDPRGVEYNVIQSKIAIGSGGFLGKGYLNGTQTKLKYVPEQTTDFIFCTVGEEQGFVGSVIVLLLFGALIFRILYLAERQRNTFGRVYGYCVGCIFLFHVTINIGMVIGLAPVIGIPLPFFSYGGSSILAFTILLFVFLRIDMSRKRR